MPKAFVVLEVNPECGDEGDYCGSVVGIYHCTVKAPSITKAVEKFKEYILEDNDDFSWEWFDWDKEQNCLTDGDVSYFFEEEVVI